MLAMFVYRNSKSPSHGGDSPTPSPYRRASSPGMLQSSQLNFDCIKFMYLNKLIVYTFLL